MQYAEFYQNGFGSLADTLQPACGSDSVFILDGRFGLARCAEAARVRMEQLSKVQPHYRGFTINAGRSFSDSRIIRKLEKVK